MRDKKKKSSQSKAARVTAAKRREREAGRRVPGRPAREPGRLPERPAGAPTRADEAPAEAVEYKGGGLLTGMRSGFQSAVGVGSRRKSWSGTVVTVLLLLALFALVWTSARW